MVKQNCSNWNRGAGYAAYLHGNGYEKVNGVSVRLKTVCDLNLPLAEKVKERYGYEQAVSDYRLLLEDPEIEVIDIVLPPFCIHPSPSIEAMGRQACYLRKAS